jgi:Tfp pilus assembly protein PilN
LLNLGLIAFIAAAVSAGGLYFYRRSVDRTRAEWAAQVEIQESELRPELLAQLIDLSNTLTVTRELLQNHTISSNVFTLLQETTHPKVQYTTFAFSVEKQTIEVAGLALSYQAVAEQVRILEGQSQVAKVGFGGLALGEKGLISFRLSITVKPSLLKLRSPQS